MQKSQKQDIIRIVLYSLSSLLVGSVVGGTLLMRIMQQPPADALAQSAALLTETTTETVETETESETDTESQTTVTTTSETTTTTTTTTTTAPPDTPAIQQILRPAEDLLTASYYYTDSESFEQHSEVFGQRVPFTTDSVILTFDGVITLGIPMDEIRYEINAENRYIRVLLPEPELISHEIDENSVHCYDVSDSIFRSTSLSEFLVQLRREKPVICQRVRQRRDLDRSILEQADRVVRSLLSAAPGTRDYTVLVLWDDGDPEQYIAG